MRGLMGGPQLRFGVLSDVHVRAPGSENLVEKAFAYFREREVDAVLIAGDIADRGLKDELRRCAEAWEKVFPDGSGVRQLFIYGNHDWEGWRYGLRKGAPVPPEFAPDKLIETDPAATWKEFFREDYRPIMLKEVGGFKFVLCQTKELRKPDWEAFVAAHGEELKAAPLFFYAQHYHPKGTCSAPWVWGQDSGYSTSVLSQFPNCVAFSGHSHTALTDARTIRQGDFNFTSVGTASLRYLIALGGRENSVPFGERAVASEGKQMPDVLRTVSQTAHHGQVVSVYGDRLEFERIDIETGRPVAATDVMPLDDYGALSYERRAASAAVPEFAADATATVSEGKGKTMRGAEVDQVKVTFPTVRESVRAFDYDVTVRYTEGDLDKVAVEKRVYSYQLYRPVEFEEPTAYCAFARDELPHDVELRFEIRPLNCFGGRGAPIRATYAVESEKTLAKKRAKAKRKARKDRKAKASGKKEG